MSVISANKFSMVPIVGGGIVLLALLASAVLQDSHPFAISSVDKSEVETITIETFDSKSLTNSDNNLSNPAPTQSKFDQLVMEFVAELHAEFGRKVDSIALQVSLMELRNDLVATYPEQGNALFERMIRTAFPEQASEIFQTIAKMDLYNQWLLESMPDLNRMDLVEQEETLWAKRYELFDEVASDIWTPQWTPEQEREESVHKTLKLLETAYDTPLEERLYLLQSSFEESYGNTVAGYVFDPKSVMSQAFLHFDSVQKDLSAMPQAERQTQIADIRRELGFPEDRITILADRDQKRELDWQNGYTYMEKREQAEQYYSGEILEAELDKLREQYFTHRAPTIKKEEGEEFFRYTRPRVYGQN